MQCEPLAELKMAALRTKKKKKSETGELIYYVDNVADVLLLVIIQVIIS